MIPFKDDIPKRRFPLVTVTLIAIALAAFIAFEGGIGELVYLGLGLLCLWIFGASVEDSMGRPRFVAFCAVGGGAALGLQALAAPDAPVVALGAPGAVATVLGGYAVLYPRARVVALVTVPLFFTVVAVPALLVLGAWVALQVALGLTSLGDPVAGSEGATRLAQLTGLAFGALLIRPLANRVHEDCAGGRRMAVQR